MAEEKKVEETTQKTTQTTDESKKTETETMIPKSRFDEVNTAKKELEAKVQQFEKQAEDSKKANLIEEKKFQELSETLQAENNGLKLVGTRRDLIQEALNNKTIHQSFSKMVVGGNEDELKASIVDAQNLFKELNEGITKEKTAVDDSGKGKEKAKPMSTEEWSALYDKDPDKANKYLSDQTV